MTHHVALLISLALSQAPQPADAEPAPGARIVTVELLDGTSVPGEAVTKLSPESIEISSAAEPVTFAVRDLQAIRWGTAPAEAEPPIDTPIEIQLQDGSMLHASEFNVRQRAVQLKSPLGEFSIPVARLRSARLAPHDDKLASAWTDLRSRDVRNDLLVIRKGDALDFVGGVIGELNEKECRLLVKEREVAVLRTRIFGLVFVAQANAKAAPVGEVQTVSGDRLVTDRLALADGRIAIRIGGQAPASVPVDQVAAIDFTLGKVKYLTDLPMEQTQFAKSLILTPSVFEVRKNSTALGQSLRIGNRDFTRGLWIHSGVAATFRLGREYRKFTAVMGLDANSPELSRAAPELSVTISGDGKPLFDGKVLWSDEPKPLDLDVSGVRDLEIRVAPGQDVPGTLEHLDLGDARVIK